MLWKSKAIEIANKYPEILRTADEKVDDLPRISRALDEEAQEILQPYEHARLFYNPLKIDELLQSLSARLGFCYQTRERAQQIEGEAFREVLDIEYREKLHSQAVAQLAWAKGNEPKLLRNQRRLTTKGDEVSAPAEQQEEKDAWDSLWKNQQGQLDAMRGELDARTARLKHPMGTGNYVERFGQLRKSFRTDLIEAYVLARAVSVGLGEIYKDIPAEYRIDPQTPPLNAPHFLDRLIEWARSVNDAISRHNEFVRFSTILIPFHLHDEGAGPPLRLMTKTKFESQLKAGQFIFSLSANALEAVVPASARLRGIDIWSTDSAVNTAPGGGATESVVRARARPPEQSGTIAPFNANLEFTLPPVRDLSLLDENLYVPWHLVNVIPFGEWSITLDGPALRGEDVNTVWKNLFLRMRFRFHRK